MNTSKIRIIIATAVAAVSVGAVMAPAGASAASPKTVKAGSTGNAKLDDICKQMADVINNEIAEGNNAEANGDYGSANAWYAQASDHTSRAQAAGCVMSIRAPRVVRFTGALANVTGGSYTVPTRTTYAKKISGTAGGGKGQLSQSQCDDIAGWVNDALKKSSDAAAAGDADLAAGWRQNANDLLATGRKGGCSFSAAIRIGNRITTSGTLSKV
jgi:flagellar hook-basal body complex protein FliE